MVYPGLAILEEAFSQTRNDRAIEPLHIPLGLWSIGHAGALFRPADFAHVLQQGRREFASVITRQQARRADEADETLKCPAHSLCVLISEFVEFDKPRKDVHENEHVLKCTFGNGQFQ